MSTPATGIPIAARPRGRATEFWLLVGASLVVTAALAIVEFSQEQTVTWDLLKYTGAFLLLYGVSHVMIRLFAPLADQIILPIVALLNGLGLVMIHRLDLAANEAESFGAGEVIAGNANRQVLWTFVSVVIFCAVIIALKNYRVLARYTYTLGLAGLVFLTIPLLLPSSLSEVNGSKIWIKLPFFSIQPGEFAKIALIIFFAGLLVNKRALFTTAGGRFLGMDYPRPRDLGPLLVAWGAALAIFLLSKDLGQGLLLFMTVLTMLYVATGKVSWVLIGLVLFAGGCIVAFNLFTHVQTRYHIWVDPLGNYQDGGGFQLSQALFGLATGGLGGTGLGNGRPNLVPLAESDFIISSLGEELGLFGLAGILLLFLVLVMRGLTTAAAVPDSFGKLLAAGLCLTIVIQLFVVVGGVSNLIPLTGLTTPFMSYGGSSLLANYILVAILLRISHDARTPLLGAPPARNWPWRRRGSSGPGPGHATGTGTGTGIDTPARPLGTTS